MESKRLICRESECNDLCEILANINTINKFIERLDVLEIGLVKTKVHIQLSLGIGDSIWKIGHEPSCEFSTPFPM